ncbi:hypothetical protein ABZ921_37215 [Streptomyces atriruber]|uniref:Uncharacterized protein n=1 Tax=Streptomyces atriruber TaxID=545121 RepID=A0ABV3BZ42_9ACTN
MHPTDHQVAWGHAATRQSWIWSSLLGLLRLLGWTGVALGSLFAIVGLPVSIGWILFPFLLYAPFRALVECSFAATSLRVRRVLREYPWQILGDVPKGIAPHPAASDKRMWFELPNPDDPVERVPLTFLATFRSHWWFKRIGAPRTKPEIRAQIEPLWFAGDPRFLAVAAAPGREGSAPRRLHLLYQASALDRRAVPGGWTSSPASLERARRAGARVL